MEIAGKHSEQYCFICQVKLMIIIDTTQPKTQNNLKQTGDDYNYGISIQTRNLMFNPTTYIMEDDFIFFENGRLPQFFRKCKMTSFF
jgi:hypothetical protein